MSATSLADLHVRPKRHARTRPADKELLPAPPMLLGGLPVHSTVRGLSQASILQMQRTNGNGHVQRLLSARRIQRQGAGGEPTLKPGAQSPAVATLQHLLAATGASVTADGVFGPMTQQAVRVFQQSAGLTPDGIVGPMTWGKLKAGGTTAPAEPAPGGQGSQQQAAIAGKLGAVKAVLHELKARGEAAAGDQPSPVDGGGGAARVPEKRQGWLDDVAAEVEGAVEGATDWIEETAEGATSWVEEQVESAGTWAGEQVDAATDWAAEQYGAAEQWVEETAGAVGKTVQGVAEAVVEVAAGIGEDVQALGDDLRERYKDELAVLDEVVRDLTRPFAFDDLGRKLDDLLTRLKQLAAGAVSSKETDPGTKWDPTKVDQVGSTTINVVPVSDTVNGTWIEVINKLVAKGEPGSVQPVFGVEYFDLDTNGRIVRAHIIIDEVITMPAWPELKKQCDPVQQEWNRFYGALNTHEQGHITIDRRWFADLHRKMIGRTSNDAVLPKNAAVTGSDAENAQYDSATQHGITQGTGITPVQCGLQKVQSGGT